MSRSFKRVWGYKDRNPYYKNQANRKVRRTRDVPNGKAYRKLYEHWMICDFKCLIFPSESLPAWVMKFYSDCAHRLSMK